MCDYRSSQDGAERFQYFCQIEEVESEGNSSDGQREEQSNAIARQAQEKDAPTLSLIPPDDGLSVQQHLNTSIFSKKYSLIRK